MNVDTSIYEISNKQLYMCWQQAHNRMYIVVDPWNENDRSAQPHLCYDNIGRLYSTYNIQKPWKTK